VRRREKKTREERRGKVKMVRRTEESIEEREGKEWR
jgi:hypothetical protein